MLPHRRCTTIQKRTRSQNHHRLRTTSRLGGAHPTAQLTVAATIRNRLLTVPGRLVNHSGRRKLRLPSQWPWATAFTNALQRIRNLPLLI